MSTFVLSLVHGAAAAAIPLHGELADDRFGWAVSDAGDVDGDGYDDLLVGAPGADLDTGRVMVYLGGASGPSTVPALVLYGDPALAGPYGTAYGDWLTALGDVNGDGFDDVAIAAEGPGVVTVHHGSASGLEATPATTIGSWGFLGTRVADAGDLNDDGYDDLIIGAVGDAHYEVSGRAFVHLGSAAGIDPVPVVTWTGGTDFYGGSYDYLVGDHVAGAGDVDGDGYDDVLVTFALGDVHLYGGSAAGPDTVPTQVWTSPASVADVCGADVTGDGYDDVVIASQANSGVVQVFAGSAAGADTVALGTVKFKRPQTLSRAGDVNGDGFGDVVVGAPYVDDERGRVEVLAGSSAGLRPRPWLVVRGGSYDANGYQQGDRLGWSVSTAGDLDGDSFDDLVIGGPLADDQTGQALVGLGHSDLAFASVEVSVSGGISVDLVHATVGAPVAVMARYVGHGDTNRLVDLVFPTSLGEVHAEGALPAVIAAGETVEITAIRRQDIDGWRLDESTAVLATVVQP